MASELRGPSLFFQYRTIDIRDLDGDRLLASEDVGDNVIAILTRLRDHGLAVRRIVAKIAGLGTAERNAALGQLLILAGLRHLGESVEQEVRKMPIDADIMENEVIARIYRRGVQEGRQEGRQEGERTVLRRQIEKRFGVLPGWAEERLAARSTAELEELSERVLDAESIEDLFEIRQPRRCRRRAMASLFISYGREGGARMPRPRSRVVRLSKSATSTITRA